MNATASHALTLICGMWLGMITTFVVIGFRQIWRDRHCTCDAEALEQHAPGCPLHRPYKHGGFLE